MAVFFHKCSQYTEEIMDIHSKIMQYPGCREKKFCSAECRNKFWNIHIGDEKRKKMETYTCPNCGKTFYAYPGKLRKYCSHGCYIESRFGGAVCV